MFCAGVDLTMGRRIADPINGERFSYFMQTALCNLRNLKIPSYCVLQGKLFIYSSTWNHTKTSGGLLVSSLKRLVKNAV